MKVRRRPERLVFIPAVGGRPTAPYGRTQYHVVSNHGAYMAASHPNVVFIVGDNVGWGDINCYGGTAPTPRIDALAGQGVRFKNDNVEAQ
jgi:Sulfatase